MSYIKPASRPCFLFAGPTLHPSLGSTVQAPEDVILCPPVARGDIDAILQNNKGSRVCGTLILVDGLFHQNLAVGHAELRAALSAGWQIWGLSSMGAIRAFEMLSLGMRGFGQVFEMFLSEADFQDDEVALLHEALPPYHGISEPLVHLRVALREWEQAGLLSAAASADIANRLKSMWYGYRSLSLFKQLLLQHQASINEGNRSLSRGLEDGLGDFDRYRVKTADLIRFLDLGLWR